MRTRRRQKVRVDTFSLDCPPGMLAEISYYDGLQFADVKGREQPLPPTAVVGFNREASAAKDRPPAAKIDPDRSLISLKEMPITPVAANHDAGEIACGEIGGLAIERAALINHFERRQNPALLGIVGFDRCICEPCRNGLQWHRKPPSLHPISCLSPKSAPRYLGFINRKLSCHIGIVLFCYKADPYGEVATAPYRGLSLLVSCQRGTEKHEH